MIIYVSYAFVVICLFYAAHVATNKHERLALALLCFVVFVVVLATFHIPQSIRESEIANEKHKTRLVVEEARRIELLTSTLNGTENFLRYEEIKKK